MSNLRPFVCWWLPTAKLVHEKRMAESNVVVGTDERRG